MGVVTGFKSVAGRAYVDLNALPSAHLCLIHHILAKAFALWWAFGLVCAATQFGDWVRIILFRQNALVVGLDDNSVHLACSSMRV